MESQFPSTACCILPDYRSRYADNLGKELPRIPAVKTFGDFRAFSKAGRELAHWHLQYETVALHPGAKLDTGKTPAATLAPAQYRVVKMKEGRYYIALCREAAA